MQNKEFSNIKFGYDWLPLHNELFQNDKILNYVGKYDIKEVLSFTIIVFSLLNKQKKALSLNYITSRSMLYDFNQIMIIDILDNSKIFSKKNGHYYSHNLNNIIGKFNIDNGNFNKIMNAFNILSKFYNKKHKNFTGNQRNKTKFYKLIDAGFTDINIINSIIIDCYRQKKLVSLNLILNTENIEKNNKIERRIYNEIINENCNKYFNCTSLNKVINKNKLYNKLKRFEYEFNTNNKLLAYFE